MGNYSRLLLILLLTLLQNTFSLTFTWTQGSYAPISVSQLETLTFDYVTNHNVFQVTGLTQFNTCDQTGGTVICDTSVNGPCLVPMSGYSVGSTVYFICSPHCGASQKIAVTITAPVVASTNGPSKSPTIRPSTSPSLAPTFLPTSQSPTTNAPATTLMPATFAPSSTPSNMPTSANCTNGQQDFLYGDETDVDCGGSVCRPCIFNQNCIAKRDCQLGLACYGFKCKNSYQPTSSPTRSPTKSPTKMPSTLIPTRNPTLLPSNSPTLLPSNSPTSLPTRLPSKSPTTTLSPISPLLIFQSVEIQTMFNGKRLTLFYNTEFRNASIFKLVVPEANVWLGFGLASASNSMVGGRAVCGMNPTVNSPNPSVAVYSLTSQVRNGIQLVTPSVPYISSASYSSFGGNSTLQFTINQEIVDSLQFLGALTTETQIATSTGNYIFAYGIGQTFDIHMSKAAVNLNLLYNFTSPTSAGFSQGQPMPLVLVFHIVFMLLVFALVMPLGVLVLFCKVKRARIFHENIQFASMVLSWVGLSLGIAFTAQYSNAHFVKPHQQIGLAVLILVDFQSINAYFRPFPKSERYTSWMRLHRFTALTIFALGMANMITGPFTILNTNSFAGVSAVQIACAVLVASTMACLTLGLVMKMSKKGIKDEDFALLAKNNENQDEGKLDGSPNPGFGKV